MISVVLCKVSQPSRLKQKSYDEKFVTAKCARIYYRAPLIPKEHSFYKEFLFSLIIKKNIERTKLLFPVSSVNDNDNVVSLISIAIIFLVIAFFQIN